MNQQTINMSNFVVLRAIIASVCLLVGALLPSAGAISVSTGHKRGSSSRGAQKNLKSLLEPLSLYRRRHHHAGAGADSDSAVAVANAATAADAAVNATAA